MADPIFIQGFKSAQRVIEQMEHLKGDPGTLAESRNVVVDPLGNDYTIAELRALDEKTFKELGL